MRSALRVVLVSSVLASVAGLTAADVKTTIEHDRSADFTSLHTYAWLPTPPYESHVAPHLRDERLGPDALDAPIRASVDRALAARRLTVAPPSTEPDCHVVYYAAVGMNMRADFLGAHYGYLTGWGSPLMGATPTTSLRVLEEGTLVIDILRRDRTTAIWRGTARGAVDRSRTQAERLQVLDEAIRKLFNRFPPRR